MSIKGKRLKIEAPLEKNQKHKHGLDKK